MPYDLTGMEHGIDEENSVHLSQVPLVTAVTMIDMEGECEL